MIDLIDLFQHEAFSLRIPDLVDHLFCPLENPRQTALAFIQDARRIASKFVHDNVRHNERHLALPHQLFEHAERGLLFANLWQCRATRMYPQGV